MFLLSGSRSLPLVNEVEELSKKYEKKHNKGEMEKEANKVAAMVVYAHSQQPMFVKAFESNE